MINNKGDVGVDNSAGAQGSSNGLSVSSKIGLGIGAFVVVLAIFITNLIYVRRRHLRQRKARGQEAVEHISNSRGSDTSVTISRPFQSDYSNRDLDDPPPAYDSHQVWSGDGRS